MPKSVLPYDMGKGQYFDLETSFSQFFSPNKETVTSVWNTGETGNMNCLQQWNVKSLTVWMVSVQQFDFIFEVFGQKQWKLTVLSHIGIDFNIF